MSRSQYTDLDDNWQMIKWRGMVSSSIRGQRGQKLLKDILHALDNLPEKVLIANDLQNEDGDVCALGAAFKLRNIPTEQIDPEEPEHVAAALNIAPCLAQEIVYMNDEYGPYGETPQQRWERIRKWVVENIRDGDNNVAFVE